MIISREHRYLFVQLPRTGSTAIGRELISQYGGEKILDKHSTYEDFLKIADEDHDRYFVFSCVRNPLDDAVSHYQKLATDHHNRFTDPIRRRYRVGNKGSVAVAETGMNRQGERPKRRTLFERAENRRFDYVRTKNADFSQFFLRYHWLPYDNWSRLSHDDLDFVIRFENLQNDFEAALARIGLSLARPLPVANKTAAKSGDYMRYYTPDVVPRAKRVYGPYLRRWGYDLPPEWGDRPQIPWEDALYHVLAIPRTLYWRHLRKWI